MLQTVLGSLQIAIYTFDDMLQTGLMFMFPLQKKESYGN
jgi:hypothetical protein